VRSHYDSTQGVCCTTAGILHHWPATEEYPTRLPAHPLQDPSTEREGQDCQGH